MRRLRTRKPGTKAPGMLCHVTWGNYTHTHTHTHKHTHSHTAVARAGWERGRVFKTKRTLLTNPVMLPWLNPPPPPHTHTHHHHHHPTTPFHYLVFSCPVHLSRYKLEETLPKAATLPYHQSEVWGSWYQATEKTTQPITMSTLLFLISIALLSQLSITGKFLSRYFLRSQQGKCSQPLQFMCSHIFLVCLAYGYRLTGNNDINGLT